MIWHNALSSCLTVGFSFTSAQILSVGTTYQMSKVNTVEILYSQSTQRRQHSSCFTLSLVILFTQVPCKDANIPLRCRLLIVQSISITVIFSLSNHGMHYVHWSFSFLFMNVFSLNCEAGWIKLFIVPQFCVFFNAEWIHTCQVLRF